MVWVRSEHAGALAVLSVWVNVLVPWSISHTQFSPEVSRVIVRFPFVAFQFLYGVQLQGAEQPVLTVLAAPGFPQDPGVAFAYQLWLVAAAIFGAGVLVSIAYYLDEDRVEAAPIDPVRLLGGVLVVTAVVFTGATIQLWLQFVGLTVPIGVIVLYVLGGTLLAVERT